MDIMYYLVFIDILITVEKINRFHVKIFEFLNAPIFLNLCNYM